MRKLFAIILLALLCLNAMAYDFSAVCGTGQTLYYNITSNVEPYTVEVTSENTDDPYYTTYPTGDLEIPETVEYNSTNYSVTGIDENAFSYCDELTSITISNSVTSIGYFAFSFCDRLTKVNYTGELAEWCEITFGNPDSNPIYYAHNFYINDYLVTNLDIPETITEIKSYAFCGASCLTFLTIPNTITNIGSEAFRDCDGLTSVIIPNSVISIGYSAFNCHGLTEPVYNANCFAYFPSGYATEYSIPDGIQQIVGNAFYNCRDLISVTIPNSVTEIGYRAFMLCVSLTEITIPNTVTSIQESVFADCSGLRSVTLGSSLESIGDNAFDNCTGLMSLTIPNSVMSIGSFAFHNVKNIIYNGTASGSPWEALTINGFIDGDLIFIDNTKTILTGCNPLATEVNIPISVVSIEEWAFADCVWLTSVTIPDSVTNIGNDVFHGCQRLAEITIPENVTNIGFNALDNLSDTIVVYFNAINCTVENAFTTPMRMLYIGENVSDIQGDFNITSLDTLNYNAHNCLNISFNNPYILRLIIGDNVESMPDNTFVGCSIYEIVTYAIFPPIIEETVFDETTYSSATVWTPCGFADDYRNDSQWGQFTNIQYNTTSNIVIAVQTTDADMGSVTGSGRYSCETEVNITAIPADGYRFLSWNDGNTDNPRTIIVTSDSTFVANFEANTYNITVLSNNDAYGMVSGGGTYDEGTTATISATPYQGYRFVQWNDGNTDNPRTITVTSDSTFVANFEANIYTITVLSNNDAYGMVSGGGTYEEGSSVVISAMPYEGYRFVQWNDGNTDDMRTITVTSDSTFVANFEAEQAQQYTITVLSSNEAYGSVSGSGTYYEGDTLAIFAIPNSGYNFVSWNDGDESSPRTIVVTSDSTFIADFVKCEITYSIDTVVNNFVTVGDHTFYSTGNYTFAVSYETACDTIYDINLTVLAEPVYDIGPNPTKSLLNINSDGFISAVEFYSVTGQLVMRKEVNGNEAVFDMEGLVDGVYILRIYGEESSLPSVTKIIKE